MDATTNGQWVRTRTKESAEAFLEERRLDNERRARSAARARERRARAVDWARSAWTALRHR